MGNHQSMTSAKQHLGGAELIGLAGQHQWRFVRRIHRPDAAIPIDYGQAGKSVRVTTNQLFGLPSSSLIPRLFFFIRMTSQRSRSSGPEAAHNAASVKCAVLSSLSTNNAANTIASAACIARFSSLTIKRPSSTP